MAADFGVGVVSQEEEDGAGQQGKEERVGVCELHVVDVWLLLGAGACWIVVVRREEGKGRVVDS